MKKYFCIVFLSFFFSCKKFVDIGSSPLQVETEKIFADEQAATSAMMGLYGQLNSGILISFNGAFTLYPALSADEMYITGSNANAEQFFSNLLLSTNSVVQTSFWTTIYKYIYHANAVLEGLKNSANLTEDFKQKLGAEARVMRALCYFYLVNVFGDTPLILYTDYQQSMVMPRIGKSEVYNAMKDDLVYAKMFLPIGYQSPGRARPNKYTAAALLARIYLYMGSWSEAETEADFVIASGSYPLLSDLNQVFLIGSGETIWSIARDNANTGEGAGFIPASSSVKPPYAFTDTLLKSFEISDKRKLNWMKANVVAGTSYYYPFKYKSRTQTPITESIVVLRSAEQYLIRAEARLRLGKNDSARVDINRIRTRAGLPALATVNTDSLNKALEKERQTELFAEWGHRWFDLKRTNRAIVHLPALKPFFQSNAQLFPIPYNELQRNVYLEQNPGY